MCMHDILEKAEIIFCPSILKYRSKLKEQRKKHWNVCAQCQSIQPPRSLSSSLKVSHLDTFHLKSWNICCWRVPSLYGTNALHTGSTLSPWRQKQNAAQFRSNTDKNKKIKFFSVKMKVCTVNDNVHVKTDTCEKGKVFSSVQALFFSIVAFELN